jgi:hypothetical protein
MPCVELIVSERCGTAATFSSLGTSPAAEDGEDDKTKK